MHRRFGNAIHVDQQRSSLAVTLVPVGQPPKLEDFPAEDHITQSQPLTELGVLSVGLHQLIEGRRSLVEHCNPLFRQ